MSVFRGYVVRGSQTSCRKLGLVIWIFVVYSISDAVYCFVAPLAELIV